MRGLRCWGGVLQKQRNLIEVVEVIEPESDFPLFRWKASSEDGMAAGS